MLHGLLALRPGALRPGATFGAAQRSATALDVVLDVGLDGSMLALPDPKNAMLLHGPIQSDWEADCD